MSGPWSGLPLFATQTPLWVEPYAGSLAVGLRLLGARRPLVGWMGGKSAYADAIMQVLSIHRANEVWCADVSDWAQVWRALAKPGVGRAAADIVDELEADARSTGDCPASYRRVWHRLREDWRERGTTADASGVARWVALVACSTMNGGPANGGKHRNDDAWLSRDGKPTTQRFGFAAERLRGLPDPFPVRVWDDAAAIPVRRSAVVMLDPPYDGTSGYKQGTGQHGREQALAVGRAWRSAGATVAFCEQMPTGDGVAHDLTERRRQSRNHRGKEAQTREILTVWS